MPTVIDRNAVVELLDRITDRPEFIFSATGPRRSDLFDRWPRPATSEPGDQGSLKYQGQDASDSPHYTCQFVLPETGQRCGRINPVAGRGSSKCGSCGRRKAEAKVILQPAGTVRKQVVKGKRNDKPTRNWRPSAENERHYNPADYGLYQVYGMYSGDGARFGQDRAWVLIDVETVQTIVWNDITFQVRG